MKTKTLGTLTAIPLAAITLSACSTSATAASEKEIVYTVTGDAGKASITYSSDGKSSTQQDNAATLPWTHKMTLKPGVVDFNVLNVIAQSAGAGKITCTITVDGKEVKTATSSGEFSIATCTTDLK